ncbi:MAG TPA: AAA family ATPase [Burkholderiales bacterium]|nr:AAA family ATPase [Burkholderiales bacterium]
MYLAHFGLDEPPFRITPHTEFFFAGAKRGATLEALIYAITHDEGITKVTGEVGSGKTMLCRVLIERMPERVKVIYLANPSLSRDEILHVLAADLGVEADSDRTTIMLRALQERLIELYGEGDRVVVLIDEAHAMPLETLEEIRLLSNLESNRHKLLQIVLFGQPELNEHLALPNMRQLRERITHSFVLEPLIRSDIEQYVEFRMRAAGYRGPSVFDAAALKLLASASEGLTRRINILADKSLLSAFASDTHAVSATHMRAAIRDSGYRGKVWAWRPWAIAAAGLGVGIAIGLAGRHVFQTPEAAEASAPSTATVAAPAEEPEAAPPVPEPPVIEGAPTAGPLARERYAATQAWLRDAPADSYTIQLMTVADSPALESFLQDAAAKTGPQALHVYRLKLRGELLYGVAYGLYPSTEESLVAITGLPSVLKARGPYLRSIASLRQDSAR